MRVLVTGNTGNIGRALVPTLLEAGHELRTFDRTAQARGEDWEHVPGDLRDLSRVRLAVQSMDAVVHLAAIPHDRRGSPEELYAINVLGTLGLLEACVEAGVGRFVFFSSVNSLGNFQGHAVTRYFPIDDAYPRHPLSPYQLSKHLGEEACRSYSAKHSLTALCLRPVGVMPPERYRHFGRPVTGFMEERGRADYWSYVDVRDVCDAVSRCLTVEGVSFDAFLLAASDTWMTETTAELVDRYYPTVPWPKVDRESYLAENPHRSLVDCSHAEEVLGWTPRHSWRHDG